MRIFSIIFVSLITLSCQDKINLNLYDDVLSTSNRKENGMQRIIASSPDEIENLIGLIGNGNKPLSRNEIPAIFSNNEELFISLLEANRLEVMSSLTKEQIDSIENDEDGLEFCPSDSVIADIRFAQLLNADREIQVGETVYKYFPNGIATTNEKYASELKAIDTIVSEIDVTSDNEGIVMSITSNVDFRPVDFQVAISSDEIESPENYGGDIHSGGATEDSNLYATSSDNGIYISNGEYIPLENIRDIDYDGGGDGNWLHKTWTGIWGKNIVALKKFSNNKQLNLNFYDQNYIIYSNIGTKLKMQKKVFGIWWNIKADNLIQGWETVTIKYTMPTPTLPMAHFQRVRIKRVQ